MPEEIARGEETHVTELKNAAAEVAANAKVDKTFGQVSAGGVVPGQAHLALVTKEKRSDEAGDDAAGAELIETVAIRFLGGHDRRISSLAGHRDPRLQILGLRQRLGDAARIRIDANGKKYGPILIGWRKNIGRYKRCGKGISRRWPPRSLQRVSHP